MKALASYRIGRVTFSAMLPAKRSRHTSSPVFSVTDLGRLEDAAVRWMVENGAKEGTFKWLRRKAELTQVDLASLLGVSQETISRWETGSASCGNAEWLAVALLALGKIDGNTSLRDRLQKIANCSELPTEVALTI